MKILKSLFVLIIFTFPLATTSEEIKMKDKVRRRNAMTIEVQGSVVLTCTGNNCK